MRFVNANNSILTAGLEAFDSASPFADTEIYRMLTECTVHHFGVNVKLCLNGKFYNGRDNDISLDTADLSNCPNLKSVIINTCCLSTKPFFLTTEIEHLILDVDYSEDMLQDFYGNKKLKELSIYTARNSGTLDMADIVNHFKELELLTLSSQDNILNFEKVFELPKLKYLKVLKSRVSMEKKITAKTNPLEKMTIACVKGFQLPKCSFPNIKSLTLKNVFLSDLTILSGFTTLEELTVSSNRITDIQALRGLSKLELLDISDNLIKDISIISSLQNLKAVIIFDNLIENPQSIHDLKIHPSLMEINYNELCILKEYGEWNE